jgi:hypothetical protein
VDLRVDLGGRRIIKKKRHRGSVQAVRPIVGVEV